MQTKTHPQLCQHDRDIIFRMHKNGSTQKQIACAIGFSQGTVSKELNRHGFSSGYNPQLAQQKSLQNRARQYRPEMRISHFRENFIKMILQIKFWTPEQIAGFFQKSGYPISHMTVYRYLYRDQEAGGNLHESLMLRGRRKNQRRLNAATRSRIPNRVDISERPRIINERVRPGDLECDLVEGKGKSGYILSLYDRKTQYCWLEKLKTKSADEVSSSIIRLLGGYKVHSITYDNGMEFAKHEKVNAALGCQSYFCRPYHSWEKGGVENLNRRIRQFAPKKMSFRGLGIERVREICGWLNDRPRKNLDYFSPNDFLLTLLRNA